MLWLLSNIKLICVIGAAIALMGAGGYIESRIAASKLEHALMQQKEALEASCLADKKITSGVSHAYQSKISALNTQLIALRMRPQNCVIPTSRSASGYNDSPTGTELTRPYAVDSQSILELTGEGEAYRLRLIGCQQFIRDVWISRGQ